MTTCFTTESSENILPYGARCGFFLISHGLLSMIMADQFREDFVFCRGFLDIFQIESSRNTTRDGLAEAGFIHSVDMFVALIDGH